MPPAPRSIGLTLQLAPLHATQNIWHILSIPSPLSPAHLAGLLPHSDYILGTPSGTLRGEAALGELVEDHLNRSLVLWVYNSEFDVVREVDLIPRRGWGGEGALGAVLGFGALHRLPVGLGEEIQAPGEKMFEAEQRPSNENPSLGKGGFFVPAESKTSIPQQPPPFVNPNVAPPPMLNPSSSSGATLNPGVAATHPKRSRHRGGASPNRAFEDMFEEGAKKSQEQDHAPSRKDTPVAPPPPKARGPQGTLAGPPKASSSPSPAPATTPDIGDPGEAEAT